MEFDKFDIENLEYFNTKPYHQTAVKKMGGIVRRLLEEIDKNTKEIIIKIEKS